MKTQKQDKLITIFEEELQKLRRPRKSKATKDKLVFETVAHYMHHLMTIGHIPYKFLDAVENFLKEEVQIIYLMKTYGSVSLEDHIQKTDSVYKNNFITNQDASAKSKSK